MTFALTFVAPGFSLISRDTRVRYSSAITGARLHYADDGRKIVPIERGFISGGTSDTLAAWVAQHLLEHKAIDETIGERLAAIVPLRAQAGSYQGIFVVQRDVDGFASYCLNLEARGYDRRVGLGLDGANPNTDGDTAKEEQVNQLALAVRAEYTTPPALPELVRRFGRLYSDVRAICGPEG